MNLLSIIPKRRDTILEAWRRDPLVMVQADGPQALGQFSFLDDFSADGAVLQLGRRKSVNVGYWRQPGAPESNAQLWVAAKYASYRSAYLAFIRQVYGVDADPADLVGYEVDHLLNRARSPKSSTFIRVEAIPALVNREWGAFFEKAASNPRFYANQAREKRNMSWMVASKLAGEMPPRGPDDSAGIARLVAFWTRRGFPAEQARHQIGDELNFAFGRLRGGIVTPTTAWI